MRTALKIFVIFTLTLSVMALGPSDLKRGQRYIDKGEYSEAIKVLLEAIAKGPDNPKFHRELGIAYYKNRQYEQALNELAKAKQNLSKDSHTIFYLGLTYEQLGQYDKAIEEYSNYIYLSRFSRIRRQIRQRVQQLIPKQAAEWAKERIKIEREISIAAIPDNTIAVTYFKPLNVPEELNPLHKGLAELLINDLSFVRSLNVVERIKLKDIYEELGFGSTELVDQSTAPRLGKLLGASSIVTGTFEGSGSARWSINPILGMVKSGELHKLEGVDGEIRNFIQTEKDLVLEVLEGLDIQITKEERDKILRNIPTKSLEAFLAYSRGIDYMDSGMYNEAVKEFENAISLDRGFSQAGERLSEAKLLGQEMESVGDLEKSWISVLSAAEAKDEFLTAAVESISLGDISRATGIDPKPAGKAAVALEIVIKW